MTNGTYEHQLNLKTPQYNELNFITTDLFRSPPLQPPPSHCIFIINHIKFHQKSHQKPPQNPPQTTKSTKNHHKTPQNPPQTTTKSTIKYFTKSATKHHYHHLICTPLHGRSRVVVDVEDNGLRIGRKVTAWLEGDLEESCGGLVKE